MSIYKHYKGGFYRRLFDAMLVPKDWDSIGYDNVIRSVLHADDRRALRVAYGAGDGNFYAPGMIIVDTATSEEGRERWPSHHHHKPHVVYVSLRYGTVWGRLKTEFEGELENIEPSGLRAVVKRFERIAAPGEIDVFEMNHRDGFERGLRSAIAVCQSIGMRFDVNDVQRTAVAACASRIDDLLKFTESEPKNQG